MVTRTVRVNNENGIHCRPSAIIIKACQGYSGKIRISHGDKHCDPRSILGLMSMGLQKGAEVTLEVSGDNETDMLDTLTELIERHFDFPPKEEEPSQPKAT